jgi:preprotein translocase subunit YajC
MLPLISEAHAQTAGSSGDGGIAGLLAGSPLGQFLPLILIFVVFYFLMIRPQQQAAKDLKARIAAAKKGDRVLTAGGIIGVITKAREGASEVEVEIAPTVRVTVQKDTLTNVLTGTPAPANDSK